jgi:hypothetical protein
LQWHYDDCPSDDQCLLSGADIDADSDADTDAKTLTVKVTPSLDMQGASQEGREFLYSSFQSII